MPTNNRTIKLSFICAACALVAGSIFLLPPIPQDLAYHDLTDQRAIAGIANFNDVVSNLAFLVTGLWGLAATWRRKSHFNPPAERYLWNTFFASICAIAAGSAFYHLNPSNITLVWDRLPMTVAFMSILSIVVIERISARAGLMLFPLLLALGAGSIWYWQIGEKAGYGDLRPYILVQFMPMLLVFLILLMFRRAGNKWFAYSLGWYVVAKLLEHFDRQVYTLTFETASGHTLKHIAAALAVAGMVHYVRQEKNPA